MFQTWPPPQARAWSRAGCACEGRRSCYGFDPGIFIESGTDRMTGNHPLSPIHLQIMWDRLIAVVEEQATTLVRTGFSTSTREAGDVSAGVFDQQGSMLAQAVTGTPGHVNSMARSVIHFLDKFPAHTMRD